MSNRTFFIARTETGSEELYNCGLYSFTSGWSYAPLRMTSEDRAVFASRLAQGCDDWARLQCDFRPRSTGERPGTSWATVADFEPADSAAEEQLAEETVDD